MKYVLKQEVKDAINADPLLLANVAVDTGRSIYTIKKWMAEDDDKLLMLTVLNSIRKHMQLNEDAIITEQVNEAAQA